MSNCRIIFWGYHCDDIFDCGVDEIRALRLSVFGSYEKETSEALYHIDNNWFNMVQDLKKDVEPKNR